MYLHFNKGLMFEIFFFKKSLNLMKELSWITTFSEIFDTVEVVHCHAHKRAFSHQLQEKRFVSQREAERPGGRRVLIRSRGWRGPCDWVVCMFPLTQSCQPASQCSRPGILLTVFTRCVVNVLFPEWLGTKGNLRKGFLQIRDSMC